MKFIDHIKKCQAVNSDLATYYSRNADQYKENSVLGADYVRQINRETNATIQAREKIIMDFVKGIKP